LFCEYYYLPLDYTSLDRIIIAIYHLIGRD